MDAEKVNKLLSLIKELVGETGVNWTWKEKQEFIWKNADEEEKTSLEEFASWFWEVGGETA